MAISLRLARPIVYRLWRFGACASVSRCASYGRAPARPFARWAFRVSLLFSVAGFLALSVGSASRDAVASALLTAGTGAFEILMYYVLIQVGSRNPVGALSAFAWGNVMASWGTIFGALFGRMTNVARQNDGGVVHRACSCGVHAVRCWGVQILEND